MREYDVFFMSPGISGDFFDAVQNYKVLRSKFVV